MDACPHRRIRAESSSPIPVHKLANFDQQPARKGIFFATCSAGATFLFAGLEEWLRDWLPGLRESPKGLRERKKCLRDSVFWSREPLSGLRDWQKDCGNVCPVSGNRSNAGGRSGRSCGSGRFVAGTSPRLTEAGSEPAGALARQCPTSLSSPEVFD